MSLQFQDTLVNHASIVAQQGRAVVPPKSATPYLRWLIDLGTREGRFLKEGR